MVATLGLPLISAEEDMSPVLFKPQRGSSFSEFIRGITHNNIERTSEIFPLERAPMTEDPTAGTRFAKSPIETTPIQKSAAKHLTWLGFFALLLVVYIPTVLIYLNHFDNAFHFDDFHTIVENPSIRDLGNLALFFTDGSSFSVLPSNQSYRPLLSLSLALDYWIGGGLTPWYFHAQSFAWFLLLLGCTLSLFRLIAVANISGENARVPYGEALLALMGTALIALHPICAETVNYLIQRGELIAAFSVVLSLLTYLTLPRARPFFLYLLPMVIGSFAKPPAFTFLPILVLYQWLFEARLALTWGALRGNLKPVLFLVVRNILPVAVVVGLSCFQHAMTPSSYSTGGGAWFNYVITQPFVLFHTVYQFIVPLSLTADSDWSPFSSILDDRAVAGFLFLAVLCLGTIRFSRKPRYRPIAFGLGWFLITSLPPALLPLAEVTNSHRMFLPLIGLALASSWAVYLFIAYRPRYRFAACCVGLTLILFGYGFATRQRNSVWATEATLWKNVIEQSPQNGRGIMNYALTLMEAGQIRDALRYLQQAKNLNPYYGVLETNLGVAHNALGEKTQAEQHFREALRLSPTYPDAYLFFANWLASEGRSQEALEWVEKGLRLSPRDIRMRHLKSELLIQESKDEQALEFLDQTLTLFPEDGYTRELKAVPTPAQRKLVVARHRAAEHPSPEAYLLLSLSAYQADQFLETKKAAQAALALNPRYAAAYNNIAAAELALGNNDRAIEAAGKALEIDPTLMIAQNNRALAASRKAQIEAPLSGKNPATPAAKAPDGIP